MDVAKAEGGAPAAASNFAGSTIMGEDDVYILRCYMVMRNENLICRNFMVSDGEHFYPRKFMVDTGANVTVISKRSYNACFSLLPLMRFLGRMLDIDSHPLQQVAGTLETTMWFGGRKNTDRIHVVG